MTPPLPIAGIPPLGQQENPAVANDQIGDDNNNNNNNSDDEVEENLNNQEIGGPALRADPVPSSSDSDDNMAREKAASSISVKDFDSNTDDFDEWIELFEESVVLATNPQTMARRHELFLL